MKRIIIDYKKLTSEMAGLLLERYPEGYGDEDLIAFKNHRGEWIEAVELQTPEALYLVKIGKSLTDLLAAFEEADLEDNETMTPESDEKEYDGSLEAEIELDD
ncbi:hypothetical protein [Robiginitalea sp.]|uniref:hypothetical protein n=1 Tax=Robiginitalea sp. TaxID=1902411 RepID=UPI003C7935AD